mmetsp:Transcript_20333/g.31351  ORF Transcript_20333/g.31351 Transcript_20333/m.31351 type:complete len:502 (-) Transcript_20333:178-1683(-)
MKFHFGTNHHSSSSHHYHSGGGNDRGSSDSGGLAVMMVPAHPSSVLFMDAHPDNAATASEEGQSSLQSFTAAAMSSSEEYRQEEPSSSSTTGGGTPNDDEPAENDHTLEIPQRSSSKSRQFFRIKGRRSRSSSPVTTDCPSSCSSPGQQHHRQEMIDEHQHHCQQHRLNVMDLLRPARLRRSTSLPHTIATAATTSTNTASTSTTTSSNHSSATTSNKSRHKRCVTFTNIQIREYNTILGDHPCCQSGPPLALGWEFNKQDEVVIDIDDYENKFIDNNNHCPCNDHHESGNSTLPSSQQKVRRRSMNELRLNGEDRREILCGLMKPVEEDLTTTTTTMAVSSSTMMMMEEDDGSNENQPQLLQSHQNDSHQQILQPPHTTTTTTVCSTTQSSSPTTTTSETSPTPLLPLYTKEELRKAERKLERERRCNSGNAARTRRRLKRGFFMPLTPEEEESYKLNSSGGSLSGDEHLDYSSSSDDENGVVSMDISPKKEVSQKNSIM